MSAEEWLTHDEFQLFEDGMTGLRRRKHYDDDDDDDSSTIYHDTGTSVTDPF